MGLAIVNSRAFTQLADLNTRLEDQVRERTAALEVANRDLNRSYSTLESAFQQLEQSQASLMRADRLATLGRLAASVAPLDAYEESHATGTRIVIVARATTSGTEIAVRDWAGGMPAEVADRIFDELFTTKDAGRGTGLGLSISRNLVEDGFGGTLSVATKRGVGSHFTLVIPRTRSAMSNTRPPSRRSHRFCNARALRVVARCIRIFARCRSHKSHGAVQRVAIAIVYAHFFARPRANVPSVTHGVSPLAHHPRRACVPGPAKLRGDGVSEVARSLLYPTRRRESR